jgi:sulfur-oxidizing protein SoxY
MGELMRRDLNFYADKRLPALHALHALRRKAAPAVASCVLLLTIAAAAPALAADNWAKIRPGLFKDRAIAEDTAEMIELVTPVRAEDAAVVPIAIRTRLAQSPGLYAKRLFLIIDNNPAPLAAVFNLTPELGRADIETRVRIEEYTNIRVVAEMSDDTLHMVSRYVKASGGCSAPAGKDAAAAAAGQGKMKLTLERAAELNRPLLAQLMIRHPNNTGMAMDQVTRLYAPPNYVKHIDIAYNGKKIMSADTDISISENPNFRFYFMPRQNGALTVEAIDSNELTYKTTLQVKED